MFTSLMNSLVTTPENAKSHAKFFIELFFDRVMGGDDEYKEDFEEIGGPDGCRNEEECREYCEKPENREECAQFRDDDDFPESWEDKEFLTGEIIK